MTKLSKLFGVASGLICVAASAQVTEGNSAVEQYRIQSHYGPEEALLSPIFPHDEKLEIGGGAAIAPLSSLMNYHGYQGSLIYHINRRHAVEPVFYSANSGKLSSFVNEQIGDKVDASDRASLSVAIPKQMLAASYLFSPYHAKLHISERSVSHFDLYLGLGAGAVQTEALHLDQTIGTKTWNPGALLTTGIRMLFEPRFALKIEARDFIHGAESFGKKSTTHSFQIGLAASIFFGSFSSDRSSL
ncbi:MAG: outer membrane beta-barrel domain-containing protein [Bdellovibrionota bacterium]